MLGLRDAVRCWPDKPFLSQSQLWGFNALPKYPNKLEGLDALLQLAGGQSGMNV